MTETSKRVKETYLEKLAYGEAFHDDLWNELAEAQGPKFAGKGQSIRSTPVRNWYLIYRPRKDERQSRPRRNLNSERKDRRNNPKHISPARRLNIILEISSEQSKKDGRPLKIKAIMDTWTLQMNYPLVTIRRTGENQLTVTQERFLVNPNSTQKYNSTFGYKWQIPFVYTTSKEWKFNKTAADVIWIDDKVEQPTIIDKTLPKMSDKKAWIIGNCKQYGYYRMNYDIDNWEALIEQLNTDHKVIDVINRAQIIDDTWSLAKADMLDIKIALGTLEYLGKEEELVPWVAASSHLYYIRTVLTRTGAYRDLALFIQRLVTGHYHRIGWDNSGTEHTETIMRTMIIRLACHYNVKGCAEEATRQFHLWMERPDRNRIDPNLRLIVYCNALRKGGAQEWDFAYEQYKKSNMASEKDRLLRAMSCSQEPWILSRSRDDSPSLARLGNWGNLFCSPEVDIQPEITPNSDNKRTRTFLEAFVASQGDLGSSKRAYQQAIEETKTNIKWMKKNFKPVKEWLKNTNTRKIKQSVDVRLPKSLVPQVYNLEMKPNIYSGNPSNFTFQGKVDIRFLCQNSTSNVTLHIVKLEILGSITVKELGINKAITVRNFEENKEKEFLVVYLNEELEAGHRYKIVIQFKGSLLPDLKGFYFSSYEYNNETIYLATTQFQPTNARKAFPCFDEPALRAKFNVVLIRKKNMTALSNQQILRTEPR
uniref:Uncharacterized protein n=1 Tax=Octopus bimaculoides TaxID=37653 RepID=A0A0L8GQ56_OCTBM